MTASINPTGVALAVAFLLVVFALAVICGLKGKIVFLVVGWFIGFFWLIGAIRIAKPNSWWARHRYGNSPGKMAVAQERFPL